jgi:hypothetical protein
MFIASFGLSLKANAVFDDANFNVSWGSDTMTVSGASNNMDGSFTKIINKYKTVITFVSAIGAVTMVAVFILNFMKLGTTSGNPAERSKCITALIWSGLAAAGLGSVALVVGVFYGALSD